MSSKRLYRTDTVVLRRQDLGEADRILTLYSPTHGKFRAVAKGVRRPKSRLGGHVELFTHVNVLVAQGRSLDIVTQAEAVRPYPNIRDDLWKTTYASYAAELVDRFTEDRLENRPMFELLLHMLAYLEELDTTVLSPIYPQSLPEARGAAEVVAALELPVRGFELRLLGYLGYAPELFHCVQCRERLVPAKNRFSASGGGVLCAGCASSQPGARPVSVNAIKAMRLMSREPFGISRRLRLPVEAALEVEEALRSHINYILERQLRTSEVIDRLKADRKRELRLMPAAAGAPAAAGRAAG